MEFFENLYELKKFILMVENVDGNLQRINTALNHFRNKNQNPQSEAELSEQISEFYETIATYIPQTMQEQWSNEDYVAYTERMHHRKFWNEIPNDMAVQYFLDYFVSIVDLKQNKKSTYIISLYDFNETELFFETRDDMCSFICNYDCLPYTAYKLHDSFIEELYSE